MTKHVVQFTESERGRGGEVWYSAYASEQEALKEVHECNNDLPTTTPDYYGDPGHFTSCPVCEYVLWVY